MCGNRLMGKKAVDKKMSVGAVPLDNCLVRGASRWTATAQFDKIFTDGYSQNNRTEAIEQAKNKMYDELQLRGIMAKPEAE